MYFCALSHNKLCAIAHNRRPTVINIADVLFSFRGRIGMFDIRDLSNGAIVLLLIIVFASVVTVHALTSPVARPLGTGEPIRQLPQDKLYIDQNMAFHLLPQDVRVGVGDTFVVTVAVENATDMYAWQVYLTFDSKMLECLGVSLPSGYIFSSYVTVSGALANYNRTEFPNSPLQRVEVHNNEGWVLAGDSLLGASQPRFSGSGVLAQIEFQALSSGSTALALLHDLAHTFQTYILNFDLEAITTSSASYSDIQVASS
jgi:hypothetical protein